MAKLDPTKKLSFSFSGCGFLGPYHLGVASCLLKNKLISPDTKFLGASAGSLVAACLACDIPPDEIIGDFIYLAVHVILEKLDKSSLNINRLLYDRLKLKLPNDAHIRANGRLYISVTRISDLKNVIINQFKSKKELIKALQCSCFIPLWSGLLPPEFDGISYIDGGLTNNSPILDENTITVSPFSGGGDICPPGDDLFKFNFKNITISISPLSINRKLKVLFPNPFELDEIKQQGIDDALRYLKRDTEIDRRFGFMEATQFIGLGIFPFSLFQTVFSMIQTSVHSKRP
ncbi:patatin-like phospholipase domain-containing protein 2 isoform x1 [Dermatophagoides farinae]|nr:patatin-like phospholipase domain-containing protein 2 isoform x1 [Dermatophagoides farinae]